MNKGLAVRIRSGLNVVLTIICSKQGRGALTRALKVTALVIVPFNLICLSSVHGAETEWGFGGFLGKDSGVGGIKFNYQYGSVNIYYGWHNFSFMENLHLGFEGQVGVYEWSPGGTEYTAGLNLLASIDIATYLYLEAGLGVACMTGAPGGQDESIATKHVPGTAQIGTGINIPLEEDSYLRTGARFIHQSGIFYGKLFKEGSGGDPGSNLIGIFISYYW